MWIGDSSSCGVYTENKEGTNVILYYYKFRKSAIPILNKSDILHHVFNTVFSIWRRAQHVIVNLRSVYKKIKSFCKSFFSCCMILGIFLWIPRDSFGVPFLFRAAYVILHMFGSVDFKEIINYFHNAFHF